MCMIISIFLSVSVSAADTSKFEYGSKTGKFILELYDYTGTKTGEVTFHFTFDSEYTQDKDGKPTKVTVTTSKKKITGPYCFNYTYKSVERYNLECAYNGFSVKGTIDIPAYCYMKSLGNNVDSSKTGRLNFYNIYPYGTKEENKTSSLTTTASAQKRTVTFYIQINAGNLGFHIWDNGGVEMDTIAKKNYEISGGVARIKLQMARDKHKLTVDKDSGVKSVSGGGNYYYGENYTVSATPQDHHVFTGWTGEYKGNEHPYTGVMPNKNTTIKAHSREYQYNVHFEGNGATGGTVDDMTGLNYSGTYALNANAFLRTGYKFTGWNTRADGSGTPYTDKAAFFKLCDTDGATITLYAQWKVNSYKVTLHAGAGMENVTGDGTYAYNSVVTVGAVLKEGYHWLNWTGNFGNDAGTILSTDTQNFVFQMPAHDVEAVANGEANSYTIHFDSNGGTGHINDIQTTYETDVTLPDAAGVYKKYTLDGVNVTTEVYSLEKTYESVFLGWALYDNKDKVSPTWKAGDVVKNLIDENGGTVTLYAVWDDCPWMTATDLYYTLEQAQNGFITEYEILSHASAVDREDGSPILPGSNPAVNHPAVNTSFTIPDYQASEFTDMTHDAAVTENLTVVDSVGNIYQKQIMVYVADTTPQKVKPKGATRFISEKYFNASYDNGGLEDNSIWKTNSQYREVLQSAFDNLKNDTSEQVYIFTQEQISDIKEYVNENGVGNSKNPAALQMFYEEFMR